MKSSSTSVPPPGTGTEDEASSGLSNLYYASILAAPNYLIISTDTQGIVTTFNAAAERALGYQAVEIVGKRTPASWHDATEMAARATELTRELGQQVESGFEVFVAKARLTGVADENEWTLIRKDGSRFPVVLSVTCLRDTAGVIIGYLGVLHDITAQKTAQATLRERDERLRKLATQAPGMLFQFQLRPDGTSCFPYASEGIRDIYHVAPQDVASDASCVFALKHPDDYAMVIASIRHSADTLTLWSLDYRVKFADGSVRWLHGQAVPERLADGSTLWHGFIADITTRKSAELELQQYKTLLQTLHDPVYLLSPHDDFRFHYANIATLNHYGLSESEMLSKRVSDVDSTSSPERLQALWEFVKAGNKMQVETVHRRVSGEEVPVQVSAGYLKLDTGEYIGGVIQDLSDRKRMENELKAANEERLRIELKLAETAKLESLGVLAGGIAHDFNNILTGVLGNASLLHYELPAHSPALKTVAQIERAAQRAADLCKQMLDYSGKGRFIVKPVQINQLIEDTVNLLGVAASRHCTIHYLLAPELPPVEADETQLRQVVMNLVINASEAIGTTPGVVSLTTSVVQADSQYLAGLHQGEPLAAGEYIMLEVADTGSGMPPDVLKRIFEPFFTTKFTGRGLGLAAVQGIVRGHKGGIEVLSVPGRGTTFRLLLPSARQIVATAVAESAPAGTGWRGHGHVLIADDEESVRDVTSRILQHMGFTTETVANGVEALARYQANPAAWSLVLLDLTMPQMGGDEAFRRLRQLDPQAKVILMSGYNQQEIDSRLAGSLPSGFIPKPIDPAQLTQVIQRVLASS
ncbi:MAG TPA: PAS domain S-box protein [Candidatus Acidoferrum sp.]|nr:PAS domain S-box protein [Candidatus Acidoferrum sp.]